MKRVGAFFLWVLYGITHTLTPHHTHLGENRKKHSMSSTILKSSNCSAYTNSISLMIESTATVPGEEERCTVQLPVAMSCQTSAYEKPDDATASQLREAGEALLRERQCDASRMVLNYNTSLIGAQSVEYSAEKLVDTGMASNCFAVGNDPNDATHVIQASCTNQYTMTDAKGNRVRDTNRVFTSSLAVCDLSDNAMPQLMEDARKVAAYNAAQEGLASDRDADLACRFAILPVV